MSSEKNLITGVGLSYRTQHHLELLETSKDSEPRWLEVLADNFLLPNVDFEKLKHFVSVLMLKSL